MKVKTFNNNNKTILQFSTIYRETDPLNRINLNDSKTETNLEKRP